MVHLFMAPRHAFLINLKSLSFKQKSIIISYPNKLTESEKEAAKHSQANLHPLKAKGQARAHGLATQRRDLIAMTHDIS